MTVRKAITPALVLMVVLSTASARGDWPSCLRLPCGKACPPCGEACACGCPDDYCRKPPPLFPHGPCVWCPCDYCRKPPPKLPAPQCSWCPDDYCRKPNVRVRSNCVPGYQCVPACAPPAGSGGH